MTVEVDMLEFRWHLRHWLPLHVSRELVGVSPVQDSQLSRKGKSGVWIVLEYPPKEPSPYF